MNPQISVSKIALAAFCQEHGIRRLVIFGSALREDFGPESDIDVLVEFELYRILGLLGIAGWNWSYLSYSQDAKWICEHPRILSPYSRQDVLITAEV